MEQTEEKALPRFTANGALCDRCGAQYTTRARWREQGYEYICPGCMNASERVAFGLWGAQ